MDADPDQVYPVLEDTLLLLEAALDEVRPTDRVLELGTGSGFVARHLAGSAALVIATDINPHACRMASSPDVGMVRADLTAGIRGQFDLVLCNPPYLPTKPGERMEDWLEKALDGGEGGREVIRNLVRDLPRILAPEGRVLVVISELTGAGETLDLFAGAGFAPEITRRTRIEGEDLMVVRAVRSNRQPGGKEGSWRREGGE
jgi:release factor glutamine methyltransferase